MELLNAVEGGHRPPKSTWAAVAAAKEGSTCASGDHYATTLNRQSSLQWLVHS